MSRTSRWMLGGLIALLAAGLVAGGYVYSRQQEHDLRAASEAELKAIGDLKTGAIARWRSERLVDMNLYASGMVRELILREAGGPGRLDSGGALATRLAKLREVQGSESMFLAGPDGSVRLSLDPRLTSLEPFTRDLVDRAIASDRAVFGELFRCTTCGQVHLDVAVAIRDDAGRAVAVLVERNDPDAFLFPLVQSWPTLSPTAETLLVRRDGDDVLFLNTLRHRSDRALTIRLPLSTGDLPAMAAVQGRTGVFEGVDYRGVPVLSSVGPVPGSPWFLVAKVDRSEILAEVRYRGGVVLALVALGILVTAGLGVLAVGLHRERTYQRMLEAERARRLLEQEARTTLYSIGDGVISTDRTGCVARMNRVAEGLTGWSEDDARGQALDRVFRIVNEDTRLEVESPVGRVLREGVVVGLANHTILVAREGTERPIADSGAPIRDDEGGIAGVVLVFRDQSQERQAREDISQAQERLESIVSAAPVALMMVDGDGRILMTNAAVQRIFGGDVRGLPGRTCGDLLECAHRQEDPRGCGHAGSCADCEMNAGIQRVLHGGAAVRDLEMANRQETSGGGVRTRWFVANIEPLVLDGARHAVIALHDITDRRDAEEDLRQSERRLRLLYEESPLGYQSLDARGQVVDVNPRWLEMLGFARDEVLGRWFGDFLAPEDVALFRERFPHFLEVGEVKGVEFTLLRKDGTRVFGAFDGRVSRRPDGAVRQTHCVLRDVTAQRKIEEEKRLFEAAARQQQKLEAIGTLASGVAHEINNPLNVILNYGQLLGDDASDEIRVRDYAGNIVKEGERVALIVRNLLAFARHDKESHSPARVADIVDRTLSLTSAAFRKDQIAIRVEIPEGLPAVTCRSQQIQQVLMNLLTNARDALNQRYPKVSEDKMIRISAEPLERPGGRWVRLTVEDHGNGIPPEIAARVFDPFFTTKPRDKGTGLGLSISYGIVKEHRGDLWFETEPGRGTSFHLDLPITATTEVDA